MLHIYKIFCVGVRDSPDNDGSEDLIIRCLVLLCEIVLEDWLDVPWYLWLEIAHEILTIFVYKPGTEHFSLISSLQSHLRTVLARMVLQDLRYLSGQQAPALLAHVKASCSRRRQTYLGNRHSSSRCIWSRVIWRSMSTTFRRQGRDVS